jgi:hypothetical protein
VDFFSHWKGGMVFCQVFLLSHLQCTVTGNCKRLRGKKKKSQTAKGKTCIGDCEYQGEKLIKMLSGFCP